MFICIVILTSLCHHRGRQGSRQSQSNITNVITSAHQSWVIILVQSGQCPFVHWTQAQEKQLCYCKNVTKLWCSIFLQRGTWSAFLIRLVTRQRIVIRPGDSRRALPDTTQVFIIWHTCTWLDLVTMKKWRASVNKTFCVFLVGHLRLSPKNMFKLLQQTSWRAQGNCNLNFLKSAFKIWN